MSRWECLDLERNFQDPISWDFSVPENCSESIFFIFYDDV